MILSKLFAHVLIFSATLAIASAPVLAVGSNKVSASGLQLSLMDKAASPNGDFWDYANGAWLKTAVIPADQSEWGVNEIIDERNRRILLSLAQSAAANLTAPKFSPTGEVGAFFRAAIDEKKIQSDGYAPLKPELKRIDNITGQDDLFAEIARLHRLQVGAVFSVSNEQDPANSDSEIIAIDQGGLGLPEPGYYQRTDADTVATRAAYIKLIAKTFAAMGDDRSEADANAVTILAIETQLASFSKSPDDLRDPIANYHRMTLIQLKSITPDIPWQTYFDALELPRPGSIDVGQPEFIEGFDRMLATVSIDDWKNYLRWNLLNTEASRLSSSFDEPNFNFYDKLLYGTPQEQPRWKRAVEATDAEIGDALGQLYVAKCFPPAAKARAVVLVLNLKATLRNDIVGLPWMSKQTKAEALRKIDAMAVKVGYPDHWRDYSRLDLSSNSYVLDCMNADELQFQHELNEIGKPVNRLEWGMTASTNNAYYDDSNNSINFPAGILQPPFFSASFDDAVNYGEIGATIGHEMTHGFDDQGRQFDYHGNLHSWWTASDLAGFNKRKEGIVNQYSSYEPIPGQHIDGNLTTGENIADIGGLKIAYLAYENSFKNRRRTNIEGFTPEQRFFIAYAQSWLEKERPALVAISLKTDPHSPPKYRVVGVIADTPEFSLAFPSKLKLHGSSTTIW